MHIFLYNGLINTVKNPKLPLALSVIAQSFLVFLFMAEIGYQEIPEIKTIIALITAVALDLMIIQTTFSKRTIWGIGCALVALVGGVLIALSVMYQWNWQWLHILFPIQTFLLSQHISVSQFSSDTKTSNTENKKVDAYTSQVKATEDAGDQMNNSRRKRGRPSKYKT